MSVCGRFIYLRSAICHQCIKNVIFQEYDYVFSVDIEEGKPPLQLPYNITEDPWFAAEKFIAKNNLSSTFLEEVANFIIKNTKGVTLAQGSSAVVSDPFTGQLSH